MPWIWSPQGNPVAQTARDLRISEWFRTLHEIPLQNILRLIATSPSRAPAPDEEDGDNEDVPALYDTGLSAEEGLWTRSGWAGRS